MDHYPYLTAPIRLFIEMLTKCLDSPDHLFLCGSRRFGYHISSSDTDITIYLPDISGTNSVQVKQALKQRLWFVHQNVYLVNTEDYDMKLFNIHLFQIKDIDVHIRVHHDLKDYLVEKQEHNTIAACITEKEIYYWKERKLKCLIDRKCPPSGTSIYRSLCHKYTNDSITTRQKSRLDKLWKGLFNKA